MAPFALAIACAWTLGLAPAQEGGGAPPPAPQDEVPFVLQVNRAIARGVEFLRSKQLPEGGWPGFEAEHPGGMSALVAYTLVKSGVRRRDEGLNKALKLLAANEFKSTYSRGVHLMLLESLAQPEAWREAARNSLDALVATQSEGVWTYPWGAADMSNTQFALLGLRAAHRMGLEVPASTLTEAAKGLWRWQQDDGGFAYSPGRQSTGGMTAATLAGLAVIEELSGGPSPALANLRKRRRDRELAERWLEERFDPARNRVGPRAWTNGWLHAYLWAVERYCGLTGRDRLGGRDWYEEGARFLLEDQRQDGSWDKLETTCFALLFLRRATVSPGGELEAIEARIDRQHAGRAPRLAPAGDLQRLCDWLVAGPWEGPPANLILVEPPFDPRRQRPQPGGRVAGRSWERRALSDKSWTNLEDLTQRGGDRLLWALATTFDYRPAASEASEPLDVILWLELEDGWDVYLDGARVSFEPRVGAPLPNEVPIPLRLSAGEHLLLVLSEDDGGSSVFGARLSDAAGRRLTAPLEVRAGKK
jgi:hypothetical protein